MQSLRHSYDIQCIHLLQTTESLVIEKQQKELELLIQELKDRDE